MEQLALDREYHRNYHREWYERNREKERAKQAAHYAERREERTAARREYARRNRPKVDAAIRRWRTENPEKVRAYALADAHRRRGARLDTDGLAYRDVLLRDPCSYCGAIAGEIDHIEPVRRDGSGGWENLTAACRSCNAQKSNKPLLMFLRDQNVPPQGAQGAGAGSPPPGPAPNNT